MDLDRPHHRTTSSSSELFICFTSRLSSSSSSMKLSKSILSPGRSRDQPMSLPTSLSRRLRTNGSLKGGQASPMFPATTTSKKRGPGFENTEPSSPKVTCIGQVRVKTKKKAAAAKKQTRSLSRRRSGGGGGEVSFRRIDDGLSLKSDDKPVSFGQGSQRYGHPQQQQQQECLPHRNQRWVHLPLTICEALRAFGAEFSCLFPCKSWCFSTSEREKEGKGDGQQHSSCGAVFARWLVTLQDGEGGKEREIELVVGEEDEESTSSLVRPRNSSTRRRHVLEDFEVKGEMLEAKTQGGGGCGDAEGEKEEARVSICIPPKNALLLMRCRSDPVKMAALTNRFWEAPPVPQDEENEEDDDEEDLKEVEQLDPLPCECRDEVKVECGMIGEKHQVDEKVESLETEECDIAMQEQVQDDEQVELVEDKPKSNEQEVQEDVAQVVVVEEEGIEAKSLENKAEETNNLVEDNAEEQNITSYSCLYSDKEEMEAMRAVLLAVETAMEEDIKAAALAEALPTSQETSTTTTMARTQLDCETEDLQNMDHENEVQVQEDESTELRNQKEERGDEEKDSSVSLVSSSSSSSVLPDCLLLMMCEPKLSMEVSKETWVCRTDFIRCLPQRHNNNNNNNNNKQVKPSAASEAKEDDHDDNDNAAASDEAKNKRVSFDSKSDTNNSSQVMLPHQPPPPPQLAVPPRSSCSLPAAAAVSMATMIEQKLVNAVGYEPFVLTRCKSEPMRTAAKLAAPDACFWTKRKLEPLRRAAYQVGAAGVGF